VKHTFFVPVRTSKAGTLALCIGRLPSGERVGLAFTSEADLLLTMGPSQQRIRLGEQALRTMLAPLSVKHIRIDPRPAGDLGTGSSLARRQPGPFRFGRPGGEDPQPRTREAVTRHVWSSSTPMERVG
jgi:hypothetical protein